MPENKHLRFLLTLLYIALGAAGLWLLLRFLLPWLLPFLCALGLAALLEPAVGFLTHRAHMARWAASALCTALLVLALMSGLFLFGWRLCYEAAALLKRLPELLSSLSALGGTLQDLAYRLIVAAPVSMQDGLRDLLQGTVSQGITIPAQFYQWVAAQAAALARVIPDFFLFFFTTALATYFSSAHRAALTAFLRRQIPRAWRPTLRAAGGRLKSTFGGWLRAQGSLMLITFGELTTGFFLLRVDLALLLAALVALVDALPVFGTGTILLPWAVLTLLGGNWRLALGLLLLYWVVSAVRGLLEPKLVGDRVGLPPLAALLAMYVGFQAFGVAGMILSPLAAMFLKELHDCGFLRLWRD